MARNPLPTTTPEERKAARQADRRAVDHPRIGKHPAPPSTVSSDAEELIFVIDRLATACEEIAKQAKRIANKMEGPTPV